MRSFKTLSTSLLCLGSLLSPTSALVPLSLKGNRFIQPNTDATDAEDGNVFFINGVDYQPGGSSDYSSDMTSDILTDPEVCARDATVLQNLGVNTIRIYTIDPDLNHDECMSIFNNAGIYVILDVNSPLGGESLNRADPASDYNANYLSRVFDVIESFRSYSNVIGFFIGNEVINEDASDEAPRYLRAITRDARNYIKNRMAEDDDAREVYVGYSAADVVSLRMPTYEYLTCALHGNQSDVSSIEFFGLNSYEWCSGVNDWDSSGYEDLIDDFKNSSVPVFFSEYGCNTNSPRTFEEVSEGIYSDHLINILDGGLVYEYSEESSKYGLVNIDDDDKVILSQDYFNFKNQLANSSIPTISSSDVKDYSPATCNVTLIESYDDSFNANFTLPEPDKDIQWMIDNGQNVSHPGKFVDVDDYLNVYISGSSASSGLSRATFSVSGASSSTSLYLTISSEYLVNSISTTKNKSSSSSKSRTSSSTSSTTSSSSSSSSSSSDSSSSVSSISSSSSNNAGHNDAGRWASTLFALIFALM